MDDREKPCAPVPVPPGLRDAVGGYRWARDRVGESGAAVHRLYGRPGAADAYLKHGGGAVVDDIVDEMVRLRWLAGRMPVPAVLGFVAEPDAAWLLTSAITGPTAYQLLESRPDRRGATVDAMAAFLRRLHAIPVTACPFIADHGYRLARARARIDAGLVEEDDFDAARAGWTAEQVWDAMQRLLPFASDPVVTHGDFSLDNILMHGDGGVAGCIDVGRVGVADRWQDLAILWNCLGEFDAALQARFLDRYGIGAVDRRKLDFHLMLDELF